jgi:hypothetical protein
MFYLMKSQLSFRVNLLISKHVRIRIPSSVPLARLPCYMRGTRYNCALQKRPLAAWAAAGARPSCWRGGRGLSGPAWSRCLVVLRRLGLDVGRPEPWELDVP